VNIDILLIESVLLTVVLLVDPEGLAGTRPGDRNSVDVDQRVDVLGLAVELGRPHLKSAHVPRDLFHACQV
jgi:hypothetical protein